MVFQHIAQRSRADKPVCMCTVTKSTAHYALPPSFASLAAPQAPLSVAHHQGLNNRIIYSMSRMAFHLLCTKFLPSSH
jgi:hypothetical protein